MKRNLIIVVAVVIAVVVGQSMFNDSNETEIKQKLETVKTKKSLIKVGDGVQNKKIIEIKGKELSQKKKPKSYGLSQESYIYLTDGRVKLRHRILTLDDLPKTDDNGKTLGGKKFVNYSLSSDSGLVAIKILDYNDNEWVAIYNLESGKLINKGLTSGVIDKYIWNPKSSLLAIEGSGESGVTNISLIKNDAISVFLSNVFDPKNTGLVSTQNFQWINNGRQIKFDKIDEYGAKETVEYDISQ